MQLPRLVRDSAESMEYAGRRRRLMRVASSAASAGRRPVSRDATGLQPALRGSQHLPDAARRVVYADHAYRPGWTCFDLRRCVSRAGTTDLQADRRPRCRPPPGGLACAWDWAGNTSVRNMELRSFRPLGAGVARDVA
jgi:hypothetical protein